MAKKDRKQLEEEYAGLRATSAENDANNCTNVWSELENIARQLAAHMSIMSLRTDIERYKNDNENPD